MSFALILGTTVVAAARSIPSGDAHLVAIRGVGLTERSGVTASRPNPDAILASERGRRAVAPTNSRTVARLSATDNASTPRATRLFDTEGPLVTMPQSSGNVYSKNLNWLIQFCDDSSLNASSRKITRDGVQLTDTYATGTKRACGAYATSSVTISNLVAGSPTTIHAEIKDNAGNLGSADVTITYVPTYTVTVTPDSSSVSRQSDVNGVQSFTLKNTGSETATYTLTPTCSGGVSQCSAPASVQIASQQTASVSVSYHTGIGPTTGTVALGAVAQQNTSATGSGSMTVNVAALPTNVVTNATLPGWTGYDRSSCLAFGIVPNVAAQCDAFRITHPLPPVFTRGKARVPTLVYYSDWVYGAGVSLNLAVPLATAVPDSVQVTVSSRTWNNSTITPIKSRVWAWGSTYGHSPQRLSVYGVYNGPGIFRYRLDVRYWYNSNPGWQLATASTDGELLDTQRRSTDTFGSGWWLAGVEQLVFGQVSSPAPTDSVLMWIGGDGSMRKYVWQSLAGTRSTYLAANSLDGPDTLIRDTSLPNPWMRLAGNNVRVVFDGYGRHVMTINRVNDTTRFAWKAGGGLRLDTLIVPAGLIYVFNHDASDRLTSVSAPPAVTGGAARVTQIFRQNNNGTLSNGIQKIIDPAGDSVMFAWTGWSTDEFIGARTDRNGVTTTLGWDGWGPGLVSASTPVGDGTNVVHQWTNQANLGMNPNVGPISTGSVYTRYTNPRNYGTTFFLNSYGGPDSILDPLNRKTTIARGDARFPGLATQVVAPNGLTSQMVYNARGLDSVSVVVNPLGDGVNDTTRYVWDSTWDMITAVHTPAGTSDSSYYDAPTGNLLWQQDGRGVISRVNYTYDTQNRVIAVQPPGNTTSQLERIYYDPVLGNVDSSQTALGFTTRSWQDAIGRPTRVETPIDSAQTLRKNEYTWYNTAGLVDSTMSIGPAVSYTLSVLGTDQWAAPTHADTLIVKHTYDHEGRTQSVQSYALPITLGLANEQYADTVQFRMSDGYAYDGLGRVTSHSGTGGASETMTYDPAGNVLSVARASGTVASQYDALNRVTMRVTPARSYARQYCEGFPNTTFTGDTLPFHCWEVYPAFPNASDTTSYAIPADTARFTYDAVAGTMLTADNLYATVHRSYYPNGALKTDTSNTASRTPGHFSAYVVTRVYDRNGRDTLLTTSWAGNLHYRYRTDDGALDQITDPTGNWVRYTYDAAGRTDSLAIGASGSNALGVWETHSYDAEGRLTRRIRKSTGTAFLFDESFGHDAQGRATRIGRYTAVSGRSDTTTLIYSGLGAVEAQQRVDQLNQWESEEYRVDAWGNVRASRMGLSNNYGAQDPRYFAYKHSPSGMFRGALASDSTISGQREAEVLLNYFEGSGSTSQHFQAVSPTGYIWNGSEAAPVPLSTDIQSRSYYDAANRLRAVQTYNIHMQDSSQSGSFDEYFYDALGRRMVVSSRQRDAITGKCQASFGYCITSLCTVIACSTSTTRTVWDGDAVLAEDRSSSDAWNSGRVTYVHAGGTDEPVAVLDASVTGGLRIPHPTWRGQYESSSTASGSPADCALQGGLPCVAWKATGMVYQRPAPISTGSITYYWVGNLLMDQQDASGLLYRRNRYYDPSSGRFTQEDPAGLAGGLNVYGFAGGDPVNFSDPFGLCDPMPFCLIVQDVARRTAPLKTFVEDDVGGITGVNDLGAGTDDIVQGHVVRGAVTVALVLPIGIPARRLATLERYGSRLAGYAMHLTRMDLRGAVTELRGLESGGEHLQEVREAMSGLRHLIGDLNQALANPDLSATERKAFEGVLAKASRALDRAEEALRTANK